MCDERLHYWETALAAASRTTAQAGEGARHTPNQWRSFGMGMRSFGMGMGLRLTRGGARGPEGAAAGTTQGEKWGIDPTKSVLI